jgi:hypothetical protein
MTTFPERLVGNRRILGAVRYELVESDYSSLFELNSTTGRLYLKRTAPFGGDPTTLIELTVKVSL